MLPELIQIGLGRVVAVADLLGGGHQLGVQQALRGPRHHQHPEQRHQDRRRHHGVCHHAQLQGTAPATTEGDSEDPGPPEHTPEGAATRAS